MRTYTGHHLVVPLELVEDRRLRIGAHHTWMVIAALADGEPRVTLTRQRIMSAQGISYPTLVLYIRSLVDHGWLKVERSVGKLSAFTVHYVPVAKGPSAT